MKILLIISSVLSIITGLVTYGILHSVDPSGGMEVFGFMAIIGFVIAIPTLFGTLYFQIQIDSIK